MIAAILLYPTVVLAAAVVSLVVLALEQPRALRNLLADLLVQDTPGGRRRAFVLYLLGARWSGYSGNPVLVLRADGDHEDLSFCGTVFPDCRAFFGVTVRQDGSPAWVVGELQLVDGLREEVVDEKRYPPGGLRWAARHYRELR